MLLLPLKDNNPTKRFPIITVIIIALNCLVFFYQKMLTPEQAYYFIVQFGYIPLEMTSLVELTPDYPFSVWLSPLTSMFMHSDYAHIAGNMLYLWIFGNNVEDFLGRTGFVFFYLMAGIAAIALFTGANTSGTVPLVGASGAIAGVMGAYFVKWPKAKVMVIFWLLFFVRTFWLSAVWVLGGWIFLQIVMSVFSTNAGDVGGVAWFAHIGGFLYGWLFFFIKAKTDKRRKK